MKPKNNQKYCKINLNFKNKRIIKKIKWKIIKYFSLK